MNGISAWSALLGSSILLDNLCTRNEVLSILNIGTVFHSDRNMADPIQREHRK